VNSPNLLSVLDLIIPRIDFHRTNYGIHDPMSNAMRQFNEVIGLFDFGLTRDQLESSKTDFVGLSISSSLFREHCALPCYCALSFSTVNVLSGIFYSPHQLIFVTKLSRYFLILFLIFFSFVFNESSFK
jgi:hypothetical protein